MKDRWICFCSQTGTEILRLSKSVNRIPKLIVTNSYESLEREVLNWIHFNAIEVLKLPSSPSLNDYKFLYDYDKNYLITLHGYLKIIPKKICEDFLIYNGHPGLITEYPELKGKDPQEKAFRLKHKRIGSVIHLVSSKIDGGDILITSSIDLDESDFSLNDYFNFLKNLSLDTWEQFFRIYFES